MALLEGKLTTIMVYSFTCLDHSKIKWKVFAYRSASCRLGYKLCYRRSSNRTEFMNTYVVVIVDQRYYYIDVLPNQWGPNIDRSLCPNEHQGCFEHDQRINDSYAVMKYRYPLGKGETSFSLSLPVGVFASHCQFGGA